MIQNKIKTLAYYLPQYHPIPENDEWWGKGFTEWTNVGKAKPLYEGHEQPLLPADLGYYDLRVPEIRQQQAQMAKDYGIHGFIYYHYWFGNGVQLLERIAEEVLKSKKPDLPFCFCWANETWSGIWHGLSNKILAEQVYPEEDLVAHFNYLLPFFQDDRYIKVDGKPLIIIYDPKHLEENSSKYLEKFRSLIKENGFPDFYIMASNKLPDDLDYQSMGYDAKISNAFQKAWGSHVKETKRHITAKEYYKNRFLTLLGAGKKLEQILDVKIQNAELITEDLEFVNANVTTYPMVLPNWDNTPRSGKNGIILANNSPEVFEKQLNKATDFIIRNANKENFLIVKSWNEWAEGNILEPDMRQGFGYLKAFKNIMSKYS